MLIRRLAPDDAAQFRALRLRALREHPQAFTSSFEEEDVKPLSAAQARLGEGPAVKFWGAFSASGTTTLVGSVGLQREPRRKGQHKADVIGMFVAPECARQGVGRQLLQTLIDDARGSAIESLVLTVTDGNQEARSLYHRAGFVRFGLEPAAIKVDGQAFAKEYMVLQLVSS